MTKQNRQKLSILVVLVVVLGLTILLGYRMNRPPITSAVQAPEPKTSTNPPAPSDARILLDLVENPDAAEQDIGRKNLFQYGPAAPPPSAAPPRGGAPSELKTAPPPSTTAPVPVTRPGPPPAPPIPLKYQGFAVTTAPNAGLTAFLADDARHYNVTAGEILMGRYRIVSITDKTVEIEDMEYSRRQTLPLLK